MQKSNVWKLRPAEGIRPYIIFEAGSGSMICLHESYNDLKKDFFSHKNVIKYYKYKKVF